MQIIRNMGVAVAVLALAACERTVSLQTIELPQRSAGVETVLASTSRRPQRNDALLFSGARSPTLNFAHVDVSVPERRRRGTLSLPFRTADPSVEFAALATNRWSSKEQFVDQVNTYLDQNPQAENRIFLFVHGYNVSFAEAVFRVAQLRYDFQIPSLPLVYSWPSAGRLLQYVYDRDSASFGRAGLVETLTLLAETEAQEIRLVAHSMGTQVALDALIQLQATGRRDIFSRFDAVVFASPDIDVDVFMQEIEALEPLQFPMVVLTNSVDGALGLSRALRGGHPRVGQGENIPQLLERGIMVFEVSGRDRSLDPLGHLGFATSQSLMVLVSSTTPEDILSLSRSEEPVAIETDFSMGQDRTSLTLHIPSIEALSD